MLNKGKGLMQLVVGISMCIIIQIHYVIILPCVVLIFDFNHLDLAFCGDDHDDDMMMMMMMMMMMECPYYT